MIESYRTLVEPASAKITRKRSRFLSYVVPVRDPEEADARLAELRRAHHDASHHVSARRVLENDEAFGSCDDDGEPHGSAGPPILRRLEEADLMNVLAVVVRYYGGTQLGVGGLIRAYADAVAAALSEARIIVRRRTVDLVLRFPADVHSRVMSTLHRCGAEIREVRFAETAEVTVRVAPSTATSLRASLREATGDRVAAEVVR